MRHLGAEITILSCSQAMEAALSSVIFLFFSPSLQILDSILQSVRPVIKRVHFTNIHYQTKFHNNTINGTSVITPFTVCTVTMLVLLMVRNYKIQRWWWPRII